MTLVGFLRSRMPADEVGVVDEILDLLSLVDSEWGCNHSGSKIGTGECPRTDPDKIEGFRYLARRFRDDPEYRPGWNVIDGEAA